MDQTFRWRRLGDAAVFACVLHGARDGAEVAERGGECWGAALRWTECGSRTSATKDGPGWGRRWSLRVGQDDDVAAALEVVEGRPVRWAGLLR